MMPGTKTYCGVNFNIKNRGVLCLYDINFIFSYLPFVVAEDFMFSFPHDLYRSYNVFYRTYSSIVICRNIAPYILFA